MSTAITVTNNSGAVIKRIPAQYRDAARVAILASAGAGPLGALPGPADVAAIATIWGTCLVAVANKAGYSLDKDTAVRVCKSALLGMGAYYVGCKTATRIFYLIPGAGLLAAMGVSALTNVVFTYRFVLTLATIFEESGKNLDINELASNLKTMFKGNGMLNDAYEIVSICFHG